MPRLAVPVGRIPQAAARNQWRGVIRCEDRPGSQSTTSGPPPIVMTTYLIREMPEGERPRERLKLRGAAALSDAELVAILLRTGMKGVSAVQLSHQVIRGF